MRINTGKARMAVDDDGKEKARAILKALEGLELSQAIPLLDYCKAVAAENARVGDSDTIQWL